MNGSTPISGEERNKGDMALVASRRVLAAYFSLTFPEVLQIPLAAHYSLARCLNLIAVDYRKQHRLASDSKLFVYLAVDDINLLVEDVDEGQKQPNTDRLRLKNLRYIAQELQVATYGVMNCYVSVMLVGTHYLDMKDSFLGSGIKPFQLNLNTLSSEEINNIMTLDAKVDPRYILSNKFQNMVAQTGSALRALGEGVSGLKSEFDESSIEDAKVKIKEYFKNSTGSLTSDEMLRLHALAVTGYPFFARDPLISTETPSRTLEFLETQGFLKLVRNEDDELVTVDVPEAVLHSWHERRSHKLTTETHFLINACNDFPSWQVFEMFVARYYCLKMNMLSTLNLGESITFADFFRGAIIKENPTLEGKCADLQLRLPAAGRHWEMIDLIGDHFLGPMESMEIVQKLRRGAVVRESAGTKSDLVTLFTVRPSARHLWNDLVGLMRLNDQAKNRLSKRKYFKDCDLVHVHVSNHELPTNIPALPADKPNIRGAVFIGKQQCHSAFGHLFGRRLLSFHKGHHTPSRREYCSGRTLRPVVAPLFSLSGVAMRRRKCGDCCIL